ncbi:MAG: AAA family ATPase [Proteobacteria bacterium]|nr:AAA family ATPase [Pseudomonadota bacterium]
MTGHSVSDIFVGRQVELDKLLEAAASARTGRGRLVLVSGEPGIGKTRFATEVASLIGFRVLWGRCHEAAGAPSYWPWTQVLRDPLHDPDTDALRADLGPGAADIADIVPELRGRLSGLEALPPARDPAEARFRLFESLARFLLAVARRQPLLVVLDDLHWADVPSLRLLEFLTPELATGRILLVGAYRDTELSRLHPLSDALGGLTREAHVARLRLTGLDGEEVRHFVAHAAGVIPPAALTHSIHQQTEGNPLFVREVVSLLADQGYFSVNPGATPTALRIPEGIRDVIGRRLNRLSPDCNAVLTLAAVAGRGFPAEVLAEASGKPEDAVLHVLDEAVEARIIEETAPNHFQFTHALIRETLYDEVRPGQRRRLHRAVGEAVEAATRRDPGPVLADLVRHFQAAGAEHELQRAIVYALQAGKRANAMFGFEDAAALFQVGLDMIEQIAEPDRRLHAELLYNLGETERRANDYPAALSRLRDAARVARDGGFLDILADAALSFETAVWRWGQPPNPETVTFLADVLAALPETMAATRIRVMAALARARLYAGEYEAATALVNNAADQALVLGDPAAIAASFDSRFEFEFSARPRLNDAHLVLRAADQLGNLELAARAWFQCAIYHMMQAEAAESRQAIDEFCRMSDRLRQPLFSLMALGLRSVYALFSGDLAEAEVMILRALRMRSPAGTHVSDVVAVPIFELRRAQGRIVELRPMIQAFAQSAGSEAWQPGLALMHLECGDREAARASFETAARDDFSAVPRDGRWTTSMAYLVEVCAGLQDAVRASALYRHLQPWAGVCMVLGGGACIGGSADRFLGLLSATMQRWTDAEAHFDAAIAMNRRIGGRLPLAYTQHDYASMLLIRALPSDRARAMDLLDAAAESAAALGVAGLLPRINRLRTQPAPAAPTVPDELTSRELDVLRLLAIGRSNADIALVLSISLNTVATHVRSILAKTGCANRTEAASYAMRHGLHAVS